jgi:ribosome biogenesis GTPase A
VVGIPNVGKSAFINRIAGRAIAATGDKPGVTRSQQWVRIHPEIQLLDTPGILWPRFDDPETGLVLAFTGAIKDDIMDTTELAASLMARLARLYPARLAERYKLQGCEGKTGMALLLEAGRRRGCLIAGGEVDLHRISAVVLDEFRGAKLGRVSLETPPLQKRDKRDEGLNPGEQTAEMPDDDLNPGEQAAGMPDDDLNLAEQAAGMPDDDLNPAEHAAGIRDVGSRDDSEV